MGDASLLIPSDGNPNLALEGPGRSTSHHHSTAQCAVQIPRMSITEGHPELRVCVAAALATICQVIERAPKVRRHVLRGDIGTVQDQRMKQGSGRTASASFAL